MRILLTGASSFTGYWFAEQLASAGHDVTATLRSDADAYRMGMRGERVARLRRIAECVVSCPFGGERFLDLMRGSRFDVLCHHAATVENYRSLDFDVAHALRENTRNLPAVLRLGQERGLNGVVLTGSYFEQGEGAGSLPLLAFSPYGLSKGATFDVFRYWTTYVGIKLAKFVIPNPFGPLEEPRFCAYLLERWCQNRPATVKTPHYVRDNIHVSLLARAYRSVVSAIESLPDYSHHAPSGYVESQGAFAARVAIEMQRRLGLVCAIDFLTQTDFSEPEVRMNTEPCDPVRLGWVEVHAWDEFADHYRLRYFQGA